MVLDSPVRWVWFALSRGKTVSPKSHAKSASKRAQGTLSKAMPWAALGLAVLVLASMALMGGPSRVASVLARQVSRATGAIDLTIVHTNDTYGYIFPCG